jgi:hypothetical protein
MTHVPSFFVKQKITLMVNQYRVIERLPDGSEGRLLAFAQQKRMFVGLRPAEAHVVQGEGVLLRRRGEDPGAVLVQGQTGSRCPRRARRVRPDRQRHRVVQEGLRQQPDAIDLASAIVEAVGQERNATIAVVRRVWDWIPILGEIWVPFLFHFDFVDTHGDVVLTSERRAQIRDVYTVTVPDERLDFRVAASMAVALDALQSR